MRGKVTVIRFGFGFGFRFGFRFRFGFGFGFGLEFGLGLGLGLGFRGILGETSFSHPVRKSSARFSRRGTSAW
jgi:hypothetical protein